MSSTPEERKLANKIRELERRLRKLETRRVLPLSQIGEGGLDVTDNGQIRIFDALGVLAATLGASGIQVTGDLELTGTVTAHRVISDDALQNIVIPHMINRSDVSTRFGSSIDGDNTTFCVHTFTVPDGCTRALISLTSVASISADSHDQALFVEPMVIDPDGAGTSGNPAGESIPSGTFGAATGVLAVQVSGLTAGDTLTAQVNAEATTLTDPTVCQVSLAGFAVFLR